jgi:uncharacterized membrane protein (UPF0127 family)
MAPKCALPRRQIVCISRQPEVIFAKVSAAWRGECYNRYEFTVVRPRWNLGIETYFPVVRRVLQMISGRVAIWRFPYARLCTLLVLAGALSMFAGVSARAASIQPLEIVTKTGVHVFSVEMATTEEEKTTGLMYRKELADGKGMLFDFSPEQEVSMWMKNTYISLDMIFIRADGRILRIAENTEPMSTRIIPSRGSAKAVLEVIAGTAQKYGIAPGDRVGHPLFNGR